MKAKESTGTAVFIVNNDNQLSQVWSTIKINKKYQVFRIPNIVVNNNNLDDPLDIANAITSSLSQISSSTMTSASKTSSGELG